MKYFFNTRREISYLRAAMQCSIYYLNTNELPNHFTLIVFGCERRDLLCSHSNGDIFTCEDNMLFSHVKISSFRAKAHLVFHWCLYNNKLYYSFKIFPRFWLAKSTLIIHHNQLLMTKFGRILRLMNRWRQKCSFLAG